MNRDLRVLVIMEDTLLEQGIVQRLREKPDLTVQVVGSGCPELSSVMAQFQPDIAIVEGGEGLLPEQVLAMSPGGCVVRVSLDREGATLYQVQHLNIKSIGELVDQLSVTVAEPPWSAADTIERALI